MESYMYVTLQNHSTGKFLEGELSNTVIASSPSPEDSYHYQKWEMIEHEPGVYKFMHYAFGVFLQVTESGDRIKTAKTTDGAYD